MNMKKTEIKSINKYNEENILDDSSPDDLTLKLRTVNDS